MEKNLKTKKILNQKNVLKCRSEMKSSKTKEKNLGKDGDIVQKKHHYGRKRKHFLISNAK